MSTLCDFKFSDPDIRFLLNEKAYPSRDIMFINNLKVELPYGDKNLRIVIKKGFVCDGGSIPRIAWQVDCPTGDGFLGYLVHDGLYTAESLPRKDCDLVMNTIHKLHGRLNAARRGLVYQAVDWFGGSVWAKHTPESIAYGRMYVSVKEF